VTQMNLFDGRLQRDHGISATLGKEKDPWLARMEATLVTYARTRPEGFLAEDFRAWWTGQGLVMPHSDKVWGALFLTVAKRGEIINTGVYRQAKSAKNHAHRYAVWKPGPQPKPENGSREIP